MSSRLHAASSILSDACIRNWPLNLVFHLLNSTVFYHLPVDERMVVSKRDISMYLVMKRLYKRCIIAFYANRIDGIDYDGS